MTDPVRSSKAAAAQMEVAAGDRASRLPPPIARWRRLAAALLNFGLGIGAGSVDAAADDERYATERRRMVEDIAANARSAGHETGRPTLSPPVIAAMAKVERHRFVPADLAAEAYEDHPIPIGHGQTISQPYIVAFMTQALRLEPEHRVLEIGTGSGYQAAILAELVREVYTIEIVEPLGKQAAATLASAGYTNVHVRVGNGYQGWPENAPFDRVIVTAAPDALVVACCGFDKERTRQDLPLLAYYPGFRELPAVRAGRVFLVDGNAYFSRPGPRLVDSLEILAHALHPDVHPLPPGMAAAERLHVESLIAAPRGQVLN